LRVVRRVLAIAVFVGLLVAGWRFAGEHQQPVRIHYFVAERTEVPLWVALLGAFGAGAALVAATAVYQVVRLSLLARRYRKAASRLEAQVHELRNLPLAHEGPALPDGEPEAALGQAPLRGS
jgi:uncharacterized integral membrane protein